jgi:hypothetical protein
MKNDKDIIGIILVLYILASVFSQMGCTDPSTTQDIREGGSSYNNAFLQLLGGNP